MKLFYYIGTLAYTRAIVKSRETKLESPPFVFPSIRARKKIMQMKARQ